MREVAGQFAELLNGAVQPQGPEEGSATERLSVLTKQLRGILKTFGRSEELEIAVTIDDVNAQLQANGTNSDFINQVLQGTQLGQEFTAIAQELASSWAPAQRSGTVTISQNGWALTP